MIGEQVTVPNAAEAFDDRGELKDTRAASQLKLVVGKLIAYVRVLRLKG